MSGLWCTALGWGDEELAEAAAEQMRKLSYGHIFAGKSHEPGAALAEKLKEISPFPVGKVFFGCSGSEANDTQIKFAWYAANARGQTKKKKIISRHMGLSRRHPGGDQPHRHSHRSTKASTRRSISPSMPTCRIIIAAPSRARASWIIPRGSAPIWKRLIEQRRPRHHRRHDRRAGDGRGRRHRAAGRLFRRHHQGARRSTASP